MPFLHARLLVPTTLRQLLGQFAVASSKRGLRLLEKQVAATGVRLGLFPDGSIDAGCDPRRTKPTQADTKSDKQTDRQRDTDIEATSRTDVIARADPFLRRVSAMHRFGIQGKAVEGQGPCVRGGGRSRTGAGWQRSRL